MDAGAEPGDSSPEYSGLVMTMDVTEGLQSLVLDESDGDPTPRPGSPSIVITPPTAPLMYSQRPRQSSIQAVPTTPRPRLRRKAATAPPGALPLYSGIKPQPPRRCISARPARTLSRYRRTPMMMPPKPRLSPFRTSTSTSRIERRSSISRPMGKAALRPTKAWRATPQQPTKRFQLLSEAMNKPTQSFSEKRRVKETLKTKKMEALRTQFQEVDLRHTPRTPSSMGTTPTELYGLSGSGRERPAPATSPVLNRKDTHLAVPTHTRRAKHFSLPLTPTAQRRRSIPFSLAAPPDSIDKRSIYIPGPIQIEESLIVTPRRGSVPTLDPFDFGPAPTAKRFSDMVALDGLVMFFEDFGVVEPATEQCLDRFWEGKRGSRPATTPRTAAPAGPRPRRPPMTSAASGSSGGFFSPKRTLQEDHRPASPSTPGRQKGMLRKLLHSSRSSQ